jgi:hypothetical protein
VTDVAIAAPSDETIYAELDAGIASFVKALRDSGIETFESCQAGEGHAFPEPTIRFHGDRSEGFRALAVAQRAGLPIAELRRSWPIVEGEPTGPWWELTFSRLDFKQSSKSGEFPEMTITYGSSDFEAAMQGAVVSSHPPSER